MRRALPNLIVLLIGCSPVWAGDATGESPISSQINSPSCVVGNTGDVSQPVSRPYLKVVSHEVAGLPVVPGPVSQTATLLCRDREMLRIEIDGFGTDQPDIPNLGAVSSGRVALGRWRTLTEAVETARIGQVKTCRPSVAGAVRAEITWYGRERRRNTFFLLSDFSLPSCSPAVDHVWRALQQLTLAPDGKLIVILSEAQP